ncbi:MAG: NAD-dependent epimerase/dehydratase family protein [Vicinamibacterales bacterium]
MRCLLTGATGFVGGAVARQLLAAGHDVRALVRDPARAARGGLDATTAATIDWRVGDVTDKASIRQAMTGVDAVLHVAGWYKVGVPDGDAYRVNVEGTGHVLDLMDELGVPRGVYTSTLAVNSNTHGRVVDESYRYEGPHLSRYDETKALAHRLAEARIARGLPLVIVQPGAVYGPGDTSALGTLFRRLLQGHLPPLPRVTAFCWGYIDDIARGHVLALERGQAGRSYFLAGPVHTLVEAARLAATIAGRPRPRWTIPPWVLGAAAGLMRPVEALVRLPPEYTSEGLRVLAGVTYLGRDARARQELGWQARPLADGLRTTLRAEARQLGIEPAF